MRITTVVGVDRAGGEDGGYHRMTHRPTTAPSPAGLGAAAAAEPPPLSQRLVSMVAACLVLLTAGTLYMYSMYGPQFGERFGYNQSEIAFIASCANNINLFTGLPIGYLADWPANTGYLLLGGGLAIFSGYLLVGLTFGGLIAQHHYGLLAAYFSLIAIGNHSLYVSSQATNLRNWGEEQKGLAIGVPIAAFGLSAFLYDVVAYSFFADAGGQVRFVDFFLFLAISALLVDGLAVFFLRDYRSPVSPTTAIASTPEPGRSVTPDHHEDPPTGETVPLTHLLKHRSLKAESYASLGSALDCRTSDALLVDVEEEGEGETSCSSSATSSSRPILHDTGIARGLAGHGAFFTSLNAHLIGLSMLAVIGAGQMYITNVGAIILTLSEPGTTASSPSVQQAQGLHVALISISSFLGRLSIGCLLDYFHARHGVPRATWSLLGAVSMLAGHLRALMVHELSALPLLTCLISFGYGMLWTSSPVLVSELFGNESFAFYWGCLTLLPALSGFGTNWLFGLVYDGAAQALHHSPPSAHESLPSSVSEQTKCTDPACFRPAFLVTSALAAVGVMASVALVRRTWNPSACRLSS